MTQVNQIQNPNLRISIDCYIDQFRTQLQKRDSRLIRYARISTIIMYYYQGINETEAVDHFVESHSLETGN